MSKVLKKEEAEGFILSLFEWAQENNLLAIRITQHKDHIEFRYKYWKSLPEEIEKQLIENFGFKFDSIYEMGNDKIYYTK